MIGAGSGITPLISMLKTALAVEGKSKVTLIYGNRNENSIIFQEELARLVEKFSGRLSVIHVLSQPEGDWKGKTGRIDAQMLTEFLRDLFMQDDFKKSYYLCGPADMMDTATQVLDAQGVFPDLIHREFFEAPAPSDEEIEAVHGEKPVGFAHTIQLTLDGIHYKVMVQPDQYILDAAIEQGIDPPYACQSGICTTCRAKLISGKVKMDEDEGLSKDEIKQGFVLTCQAKCIEGDIAVEYI
jgi:ring-1,2-phenylacetyl-CoA epoxidase subunit PaaE